MDARGRLMRSVYETLSENQMANLIDELLHAEAERIRDAHLEDWDNGTQDFDANDAADLIDPKVAK